MSNILFCVTFYLSCVLLTASVNSIVSLDDFRDRIWTDNALEHLLEDFSHAVGCEADLENSTCAQCPSLNGTRSVISDPVDSHRLAVYLLNITINRESHCNQSNANATTTYGDLPQTFTIDDSDHETLESSLADLLERINKTIPRVHEDHNSHEDADGHDHSDHDDSHTGESHEVHEEHQSHEDHESHEENEDHEDHARCYGVESLIYQYEGDRSGAKAAEVLSYLIVNHILAGDHIDNDCPVKPGQRDFTDSILRQLNLKENATHISYADLEKLYEKASIASVPKSVDDHAGEDGHEGHAHKRSVHAHEEDHINLIEKCLTIEDIAEAFGVEHGGSVSISTLPDISLAMIQQITGGHCSSPIITTTEKSPHVPTDFQKWGLSTIAVAIISSLALLGGLLFPCMDTTFVQDLLTLFIGLAIGTMAGDALLHLIPQALGLHDHAHGVPGSVVVEDHTSKMLVIIGAIYVFFIFETLMAKFGHSHLGGEDHGHSHDDSNVVALHADTNGNKFKEGSNGKTNHGFSSEADLVTSTQTLPDDIESMKKKNKSDTSWLALPTVAWMIIVGDALHNLVDGLAIGAAFADRYETGIALSIAVLCHELPHELGDFAVLLATGLSPKKVLLANLFCACCAFVGLYIGLAISENEGTRQWIFAATAGMFLYVALVNMIPELAKRKCKSKCRLFFLQNAGLIIGFGCMLLIAVFEDHIVV